MKHSDAHMTQYCILNHKQKEGLISVLKRKGGNWATSKYLNVQHMQKIILNNIAGKVSN